MKVFLSTGTANNQRQVLDRRGTPHRLVSFLDVTPVRTSREEAVLIVGIKKRIRQLEVRP